MDNKLGRRALTQLEQKKLLVTLRQADRRGFRDYVLISLALKTGLREFEISALTCGDMYGRSNRTRGRVQLRVYKGKRPGKPDPSQQVFIPESVQYLMDKLRRWKRASGEGVEESDALFSSQKGGPISTRQMRRMFKRWQLAAGLDGDFSFHELRHTALTNIWNKTGGNIVLVQRVARHANVTTTTIYAQPSDEQIANAVRDL